MRPQPGDVVRQFAHRWAWRLGESNVIVEGDTDVRYMVRASNVFFNTTGIRLLDERFSVVSAGSGPEGGVSAVHEKFVAVRQIADEIDTLPTGGCVFNFIALFDGDLPGRTAAKGLVKSVPRFEEGKDVFVLHPIMPPVSGDPKGVLAALAANNPTARSKNCTIEDFVDDDLWSLFCDSEKLDPAVSRNRGDKTLKPRLCRFVESEGEYETMTRFFELLRALRVYARCPLPQLKP